MEKKLRLLFLTEFFDPEPTPYGLDFIKSLQSDGISVEVLTGVPNYPGGVIYSGYRNRLYQKEIRDGITIHRVSLYPSHDKSAIKRILTYVSFALSSTLVGILLIHKFDKVLVYHPPASIGFPALVFRLLGRRFVYVVQDLWPDTLRATGMVNSGLLLWLVGVWCKLEYWASSAIVVISPGFKKLLIQRGVPEEKIHVIYNWANEDALTTEVIPSRELNLLFDPKKFNVVFAGTMGLAQDLGSVLDAAKILVLSKPNVQFIFIGQGVELPTLKERAKLEGISNVTFVNQVPMSQISQYLLRASALLVHLKNDPLFEITIPSKTQAYMHIGKPVIMCVGGDAAEVVRESGAGVCAFPSNVTEIVSAILTLLEKSNEDLTRMGNAGKNFYEKNFSKEVGGAKLKGILWDDQFSF